MTLGFIISTVVAGILFFLWLSGRDRLEEAENKIAQLSIRIDDIRNRDVSNIGRRMQTPLTSVLVCDVIRSNGFIPLPSQDQEWIPFKWQGEVYFVSCNSLPGIQFYKGFSYGNDTELELLKKSAEEAMAETWYGRITFSEEDKTIAFRGFAVEKSLEHFTDSFMNYMKMLGHLIECHRYFYQKNVDEQKTLTLTPDQDNMLRKETKVLS